MHFLKINLYKHVLALVTMFMSLQLQAQDVMENNDIAMADALRENGKIYVVVVCLLLIFGGILTYLIILNKKVNKLEKLMRD